MQPCGQKCPRVEEHCAKNKVCLAHKILGFQFFSILFFAHGPT
jgi:hypothetical protein